MTTTAELRKYLLLLLIAACVGYTFFSFICLFLLTITITLITWTFSLLIQFGNLLHLLTPLIGFFIRLLITLDIILIPLILHHNRQFQSETTDIRRQTGKQALAFASITLWILVFLELFWFPHNVIDYQLFFIVSLILGIYIYRRYFTEQSIPPSFTIITGDTNDNENLSCPICMDDIQIGITINLCNHSICNECAFQYLLNEISDVSRYPITCFQHNCTSPIHDDVITYIVTAHSPDGDDQKEKEEKEEKEETEEKEESSMTESDQLLAKYRRFSLISSTPRHLRIDCPNADCLNVLIKSRPPLSDQFNPSKYPFCPLLNINLNSNHKTLRGHLKPLRSVKQCQSELCMQRFNAFRWKYHCTLCGDVFCSQCVRFKMEIPEFGYTEAIALCMSCFTELFCIQCPECRTMICYRCEMPWHNVCDAADRENGKCSMIKARDAGNGGSGTIGIDRKTKRMMQQNEFQNCPRCGIVIEKITGCNHMTHSGCPNKTEESGTHFCYCCGQLLFGDYHNEEKDGRRHFPNGVYGKCRIMTEKQGCLIM